MENQIILYQAEDETTSLEVLVEDESVWLTQAQMAELFQTSSQNITIHIKNVFKEKELYEIRTCKDSLHVQKEGKRKVTRKIKLYNLYVIISVGYRVKSLRGTQFRIWANQVLKDHLLRGYSINKRVDRIEDQVNNINQKLEKIDFQIQASLPPNEGIFFNGQVFDAWVFATDLVKTAKKSIILIDNYVDEQVLLLLSKRRKNVNAKIYTKNLSKQFRLDVKKHNSQYPDIQVKQFSNSHDRFLILDETDIYHIGASLKDLGKKWFAFSKINLPAAKIMEKIPK
jgi:hypothetical protein